MNVLIACESSGTVREAFRKLGHNAWSCDLLPADDGSAHHIQGDAIQAILAGLWRVEDSSPCPLWAPFATAAMIPNGDNTDAIDPAGDWDCYPTECVFPAQWDLVIGHPPCTYLSSSGLHWNFRRPERAQATEEAATFFLAMVQACEDIGAAYAIENPIGCMSTRWRKPDQIIQPHQFGDDASKATCLWLSGIPKLEPTKHIAPRIINGKKRWANQTDSGQNKLPPSKDRWKIRSKTYQGIADAMADQWGRP